MPAPAPTARCGGSPRRSPGGRHRPVEQPAAAKRLSGPEPLKGRPSLDPTVEIGGCVVPDDCLFDLEEELWWSEEPSSGTARVGILATLGSFAGPFQRVTFRPVEGVVDRGRSAATVESHRFTGAIRLPVDAEIIARNNELLRHPRLLNDAPYSDGWIVRVRPVRAEDPRRFLATAVDISSRLEETIRARRIRCWPRTPEVELIEVGVECSAVLVRLNEELARLDPGQAILLVTDDPTSPIEMVRWSDQTGHGLLAHRKDGPLHQFLVQKVDHPTPRVHRG